MHYLSELNYYSGDCSSPATQEQIKEQFIMLLNQSAYSDICTADSADCHVGNVQVTCGPSSRRRRDVSMWQDSARNAGYSLLQRMLQQNESGLEVDIQEFTEHAQKWLTNMRQEGKLPADPRDNPNRYRRKHSPSLQNEGHTRSRRDTLSHEFTVSFSMYYELPTDPTIGDDAFEDETWVAYDTLFMLSDNVFEKAGAGELQPDVAGLDINPYPDIYMDDEPEPSCPHGRVPTYNLACGMSNILF